MEDNSRILEDNLYMGRKFDRKFGNSGRCDYIKFSSIIRQIGRENSHALEERKD